MTPHTAHVNVHRPTPRTRTVAVVSHNPAQHVVAVVLGAVDHDIVLVEPTTHAYSHIKHIRPDLVIVCMSSTDADGCRALSMLTLDRETACIPVLTYVTPVDDAAEDASDPMTGGVRMTPAFLLN